MNSTLQPHAGEARLEWLVANVSAAFVNAPDEALDDQIKLTLRVIAEFAALDRVRVTEFSLEDGSRLVATHQWVREGIHSTPQVPPVHFYPWTNALVFERHQPLILSRIDDLPPEAAQDRESFEHFGVKSVAVFPLIVGTSNHGMIAFTTLNEPRSWSPELIDGLRLIGEIVASAIARKHAHRELQEALNFERLIAELSATFVNLTPDSVDGHIDEGLSRVGEFLDVDHSLVAQRSLDNGSFTVTHQWLRDRTWQIPPIIPADALPWVVDQLTRGVMVVVPRMEDLPPEASQEREFAARYGPTKSYLALPLMAGGAAIGALTFSASRRPAAWPPNVLERLRSIAEIFVNALARKRADLELRAALAENERLRQRLEAENVYLQAEVGSTHNVSEIVGRSQALRAVLHKAAQVAATDAPVLLLGETGTGKELIAHALHAGSARRARPLIAVNCASLPPSLIESELFGHEKGAFTGATQARPGRFELANGSTLFLDEIGDLDLPLQAKLLRALQEGEIQRLGSSRTHKLDVRIIAATNRDLEVAMHDGRFRADLYYRLAVFPIALPPLRERRDDIPLLVWHIIQSRQRARARAIKQIPQPAMDALVAYDWPGNVRELQNVIERALILSTGPQLQLDEAFGRRPTVARAQAEQAGESLPDAERAHILAVLERCAWIIEGANQAAARLGLRPSTLRNRMRKLGIRRPSSVGRELH
jgi:formate hydrogenlyase transcriptional activator